jgi:hypothetical protein
MSTFLELPDPDLRPGRLVALLAPHAASQAMLLLAARLAQRGPLRVLDGGNRFNAYTVARALRRLDSARYLDALGRIQVQRAFTFYQVAALLESLPVEAVPTLVVDFLDTFYDESASQAERRRLLKSCMAHLRRLSQAAVVVVSIRPPRPSQPDPGKLLEIVQAGADLVWQHEDLPGPQPLKLF